jgi:chemotaxis protein MotB
MARKSKPQESAPGAPLFMATYGDMVTLILCFFVLLFAMSSIDAQKFQKLILSLRGSLGVMSEGRSMEDTATEVFSGQEGQAAGSSPRYEMDTQSISRAIQSYLNTEGLAQDIVVRVDQRGVTVSMSDGFLFDSGSAEVKPRARRVLVMLSDMVRSVVPAVAVEGHTDSTPLRGGIYRDNWGLSAARAASVVTVLETDGGLNPKKLQAVGYGSREPIVPNETPAQRALNRRVDIVLLSQYPKE